ncbi:MAG: DUF1207 domain-containing protein [Candidatus Kapaibacteriales bacterium]
MKIALFLCFSFIILNAKESELNFPPLFANPFECRIASFYQFQTQKLRLDIGSTIDLFCLKSDDSLRVFWGTDFFTLTQLRSEGKFKFPVETIDYFFGMNISIRSIYNWGIINSRVRLSHISAHLADGLAKDTLFSRIPFVYSREFIELTSAYLYENFRFYFTFEFIFSSLPKDVQKINWGAGFDFEQKFGSILKILLGWDLKMNGYNNRYFITSLSKVGLCFVNNNKGLVFDFTYLNGKNIHGMFYKENDKYFGIGFELLIK